MGAVRVAERWSGEPGEVPVLAPAVPLSFTVFYRRELPRIVALVAAIAGHARAEEIAQEALLRAHREWGRVAEYDKPGAWVRRVAINLATSSRRRHLVELRALTRAGSRRQLDAPPPEVDGFWAMVRDLPPRQAAAVVLHYLDDRSIRDIADILGCAEGTAKSHLHKARQTLAARVAAQEQP